MNNKIFTYIQKKLQDTFQLSKYDKIRAAVGTDTHLADLPWTPVRKLKFQQDLESTFGVPVELEGTVAEIAERTDVRYLNWFFGEIWKPRTEQYQWTGYRIAEEICRMNPRRVLDVGCGYNPFKGRIPNLIGIDPYNNCADFQVDILDYRVEPNSFDHVIALGSINFNSREDIDLRFAAAVNLLEPGGLLWMRCNPGHSHKNGPWVEIFPWSFDVAYELAKAYGLTLETLKQDKDRLFFLFKKNV
jgi:SAM-dependent methyltransferase